MFTSSSIAYTNSSDSKPTITFTFKDQNDDNRLDVGASTTHGFQRFVISQFINNDWNAVYSFDMNINQDYRGNNLLINLSHSNYSSWAKKYSPLKFEVSYLTSNNATLETIYYYSSAELDGLNGTFTYTEPSDLIPPVITVIGSNPITIELGPEYTDAGATSDNGETVTTSGTVDVNTAATYTITYTAVDIAGNIGDATRSVIVSASYDGTSPVITLLGSSPVDTLISQVYTDAGASANDTRDGDITDNIVVTNNVNTDTIGQEVKG